MLAIISIASTIACTIEPELPREVVADDPFRDGGCGSGLKPGIGSLACTYKTKMVEQSEYYSWASTGDCKNDDTDHIQCTYQPKKNYVGGRWCFWSATAKVEGCAEPLPNGEYPQCSDPPAVEGATLDQGYLVFSQEFKATVDLPKGNKLCDPKGKQADLDSYCRSNIPEETSAKLLALCTDPKSETKEQKVDCCVEKGKPCVIVDEDSGSETAFDCAEDSSSGDDGGSADDVWTPDLGSADAEPVPIPD
jgi:hypothetical protein